MEQFIYYFKQILYYTIGYLLPGHIKAIYLGNHEQLMRFVEHSNSLYKEGDCSLIKRGDIEAILAYIRLHPLSDSAEIALLNLGSATLFEEYCQRYSLGEYAEEALMASLNIDFITIYFDSFETSDEPTLSPQAESVILNSNDQELISLYVMFLLKYKKTYSLKRVIGKTTLLKDAEIALIKYGNIELINQYIEQCEISTHEAVLYIIRYAPSDIVEKYLNTGEILKTDAELALIERGDKELLNLYITHNVFDDIADAVFLKSGNIELIKIYIENGNILSDEAEAILIEMNNPELIKTYIENYNFGNDRLIIDYGNHEFIMTYISLYTLDDDAKSALYERNNAEEIAAYEAKVRADEEEECGLAERGVAVYHEDDGD